MTGVVNKAFIDEDVLKEIDKKNLIGGLENDDGVCF